MVELTRVHADAIMRMMVTMRRFDLAVKPTGRYHDNNEVYNVWDFAKKYGINPNGTKEIK